MMESVGVHGTLISVTETYVSQSTSPNPRLTHLATPLSVRDQDRPLATGAPSRDADWGRAPRVMPSNIRVDLNTKLDMNIQ